MVLGSKGGTIFFVWRFGLEDDRFPETFHFCDLEVKHVNLPGCTESKTRISAYVFFVVWWPWQKRM